MEWYSVAPCLNSNCPVCLSIGGRGIGKTFGWKRYILNKAIYCKQEFIYMRRSQPELDESLIDWFEQVRPKFKGVEITIEKNKFLLKKEGSDPVTIGYACTLRQVSSLKSTAKYFNVKTIWFDEFLPDNGQYLHPYNIEYEPSLLISFYLTVARGYGKVIRDDVRLVCTGNNNQIYNPYTTVFDIDFYKARRIVKNGVFAELLESKEIAGVYSESKIGALLNATAYGRKSMYNIDIEDNHDILIKQPPNSAYKMMEVRLYSWYAVFAYNNCIYIKEVKGDDGFSKRVCLSDDPRYPAMLRQEIKLLRDMSNANRIYYDTEKTMSRWKGVL